MCYFVKESGFFFPPALRLERSEANVFPRLETGSGLALEPGSGRWAMIILFKGGFCPFFNT